MAINRTLRFIGRKPEHRDEGFICGRTRLGTKAVAAVFHPKDSPYMAAVYCCTCIDALLRCVRD